MRFSRVKAKLQQGEAALIICCHFIDPSVYELVSLLGFDGIWLDLEHHATSDETAATLMRGCARRRVRRDRATCQGRVHADGSAVGGRRTRHHVSALRVGQEAAELVRWAKFAPQGERGVDGANGDNPVLRMPMPPYLRAANDNTLLIAQLESPRALDEADAIAAHSRRGRVDAGAGRPERDRRHSLSVRPSVDRRRLSPRGRGGGSCRQVVGHGQRQSRAYAAIDGPGARSSSATAAT